MPHGARQTALLTDAAVVDSEGDGPSSGPTNLHDRIDTMTLLLPDSNAALDDKWLAAVTAALRAMADDGFAFHLCGRGDPVALVASYWWEHYVDLVTIVGPNQVVAARAVRTADFDVFKPLSVVWAFGNDAEPTLSALLNLMHPDHPDHSSRRFPVPRAMIVPTALRRDVVVKLPMITKAGRRDSRLRAQMMQRYASGRYGEKNLILDHLAGSG